jgi:membrane fusion protein, multidrug efflux system
MQRPALLSIVAMAVWCLGILSGCQDKPKRVARPPDVTVCHPVEREATRYLEYTGTTAALGYVEIRARVVGFLEKINFEPDTKVKAGDLLFVIDPRQYKAAVEQAAATLEAKKAGLKLAQTEEELAKVLESKEAISWLKLQQKSAQGGVSLADVGVAQAELDQARLNLEFTQVVSPINGMVSRNLVDAGNLVGATEKTLLTTVVNDESVYCYFEVNELDLLALRRIYNPNRDDSTVKSKKIPVYLGLADEKGYPREGTIDFADTKLNPTTGTIQVRGIFLNPDRFLCAGMFARVRVPVQTRTAVMVPGVAIQFDQGGKYVLVLNEDNVVQQKRVKIGQQVETLTVIEEGLTPKDRVVINGMQRARPGSKVNSTEDPGPAEKSGAPARKGAQEE